VSDAVEFSEPARSYTSTGLLALALLAGLIIDLASGGAGVHAFAWIGALIIVVGADAFTVRTARALRSIALTATQLQVGPAVLARADIAGIEAEVDAAAPVLGRTWAEGLPRGVHGLTLRLADSSLVTVPVRRGDALARTLGVRVEPATIRVAEPEEYEHLSEVERAADQLFAVSGFPPWPFVAPEPAALVLVAGRPAVGFARLEIVDGTAHLAQLSVLPRAMRRGIGAALVDAACSWAKDSSFASITLTTFRDVAWNGPFYAKLGFVELTELTPGLAAKRAAEADLDAMGARVVMIRDGLLPPR
jgi:GNAT superfamily N-acetyltransferase